MSCEKCGCETAFMKVPHADMCVCDRCRQVAELEQQLADRTEEWSKYCGELKEKLTKYERLLREAKTHGTCNAWWQEVKALLQGEK